MRCIYEFAKLLLLFYPAKQIGKKQVDLLNATAKHIFGTLYYSSRKAKQVRNTPLVEG